MKILAKNKKALFNYLPLKRFEAGIVLEGWEVKSIKASNVSLKESYVIIKGEEAWIVGMHVSPWKGIDNQNINPTRERKLLLHKSEIAKLMAGRDIKGNTIIPISLYATRGKIKLELALAQGKKQYDKRKRLKEKDQKRQIERDRKEFGI